MKNKIEIWLKVNEKTNKWLAEEIGTTKENFWNYMNTVPVRRWPAWVTEGIKRVTGIELIQEDLK